jgi:cyclin-dependent kinase 8/11
LFSSKDARLIGFSWQYRYLSQVLTFYTDSETLDSRRSAGYTSKVRVRDRYHIVGFISSGTYGRVYKAIGKNGHKGEFAIKKYGFQPSRRIQPALTPFQVQA